MLTFKKHSVPSHPDSPYVCGFKAYRDKQMISEGLFMTEHGRNIECMVLEERGYKEVK